MPTKKVFVRLYTAGAPFLDKVGFLVFSRKKRASAGSFNLLFKLLNKRLQHT